MELGFDTIGNATLIAYDGEPVLATDPWIRGTPYFGSWTLAHEIPREQEEAILACPFVWISHGHPDHLDPDSLELLKGAQILLPDHVGGRIRESLTEMGFRVRVLPDRTWTELSPRIRVLSIADYNQDAVLLVDVGGTLIANLNDASDRGWMPFVRKTVGSYDRSFLLFLTGYGDTDMINFFDEDGNRITPPSLVRKESGDLLGPRIARMVETFGATHTLPFSSMHRVQRSDSLWAAACTTDVDEHARGFESNHCEMLPAYIRFDCLSGTPDEIRPARTEPRVFSPEEFGDDWNEQLEADEFERAQKYFRALEHLPRWLRFVNLRVGGRDNRIELGTGKSQPGVTFEAPRSSLMTAVDFEIFDDLLIGNFVKTTLHGKWPQSGLHPDFTPYVRYADNGRAKTLSELEAYFAEYRRRCGPLEFLRHEVRRNASTLFRTWVRKESPAWTMARWISTRSRLR